MKQNGWKSDALANYQLCNKESSDKEETGAFEERKSPRAGHKDQGLADRADLKINCR